MQQFQNIYIECSPEDAESLFDFVEREVEINELWDIDSEAVGTAKKETYGDGLRFTFVSLLDKNKEEVANIVLLHSPRGKIYVPNIVPNQLGRLTKSEYNKILQDFEQVILKPAISKWARPYEYTITKPNVGVEDIFPETVATALRRFSLTLYKANPFHPDAQERWRQFIIDAYSNNVEVSQGKLVGLMVEDLGWDIEYAKKLSYVYFEGLDLLKDFDNYAHQQDASFSQANVG
ncbi:hypothetical protein Pse7367_3151 [Thalassoporum mexicanum PCC 7367]|uniref:hypothetical protein n=1 Tax=Thalassoporum mexicanum TaxID=3457544 RepID=UPI00029FB8BB|nr:hypothetical protein [Pseudanabaena sp. PCC 7367]AFY71399.1 hypothetical protein Pse7367_3151 [Pseudanabaena sp. PCC 7367]